MSGRRLHPTGETPGRRRAARPSSSRSHLHAAEAGRAGGVSRMRELGRLALAAVGGPPATERGRTDPPVQRRPELRRDAAVDRPLPDAGAAAAFDLPGNLTAALEGEPLLVDR